MSYFPPFHPYPYPFPNYGGFRFPMTPEAYSKAFEPPFPSGSMIGPNTPTGPSNMDSMTTFTEDMVVDEFINRTSGRNSGGHIDNILRLNRGKLARVRMTFSAAGNTSETKLFTGIIETAARDHIILSDPQTGGRFLLLMVYLDYIEFPEEINYFYPGTNTLNIVDERVLEEHPEIMPLYHYQKARRERFIHHLETITAQNER